jgi:hypothetical protein
MSTEHEVSGSFDLYERTLQPGDTIRLRNDTNRPVNVRAEPARSVDAGVTVRIDGGRAVFPSLKPDLYKSVAEAIRRRYPAVARAAGKAPELAAPYGEAVPVARAGDAELLAKLLGIDCSDEERRALRAVGERLVEQRKRAEQSEARELRQAAEVGRLEQLVESVTEDRRVQREALELCRKEAVAAAGAAAKLRNQLRKARAAARRAPAC